MDGQNPKGVPKATLRELLAFAGTQRATLVLVGVMGILGTLAQPLAVSSVLGAITAGRTVWGPVLLLVTLFAADAGLSGLQGYLLGRSGEGIVLDRQAQQAPREPAAPAGRDARRAPLRRLPLAREHRHHAPAGGAHLQPRQRLERRPDLPRSPRPYGTH